MEGKRRAPLNWIYFRIKTVLKLCMHRCLGRSTRRRAKFGLIKFSPSGLKVSNNFVLTEHQQDSVSDIRYFLRELLNPERGSL